LPVFFHTGSAHGIHPSELPPPERYPCVSARNNPLTVSPAGIPCAKHGAGSAGRGSWVLTLSGVPDGQSVFSASAAGCSLGFCPSRARHEDLGRDFAQPPPTRFGFWPCASEFRSVLAPTHLFPRQAAGEDEPALLGFLHRPDPSHSNTASSELWVRFARLRTLLHFANALWMKPTPYRSCWDRL